MISKVFSSLVHSVILMASFVGYNVNITFSHEDALDLTEQLVC